MPRPLHLLLLALLPALAYAEPDTFELGDGHHGSLSVPSGILVVNFHTPLKATALAGSTTVEATDGSGFNAGDLVMLHQTLGALPAPAVGDTARIDLASSAPGRFELARIERVAGPFLRLRAPLVNAFEAPGAQVLLVPEYTDVTIAAGATLDAPGWDGASGGVLALLVTGAVSNDGLICAESSGLRGGQVADDAVTTGCAELSEPSPRGAWRGESFLSGRFGAQEAGYGNLANGGGGGICQNAGGGGGGNGGAGGRGGRSTATDGSRPYGGLGGSALSFSPLERLMLGGGGGAGHANNNAGTGGGQGGGAIFLRAASLTGSGTVIAKGADALSAGNDGAGGGGAGGSISVRVTGALAQAAINARGGNGGNTGRDDVGPGGGGGGGHVLVQGASVSAPIIALAGLAGQQPNTASPLGAHYGAEPLLEGDPLYAGTSAVLPGPYDPTPDEVTPRFDLAVGCGCGGAPRPGRAPMAFLLLLGLAVLRGRRRLTPPSSACARG